MPLKIGIIGGSGLEDPQFFNDAKEVEVSTPYGKPSDKFIEGTIGNVPCILLARHGRKHSIMPSDVNYRANLWGMHSLGASVIIASIACGSLQENVKPGEIVFPDSVFDRTSGRKSTLFDGTNPDAPGVCHIQMNPAYNEKLRKILMATATDLGLKFHSSGFGVCIEGPRYSSKAESQVFRSWGASIINMTMMPECCLAKELGIPYATTALVTDYDCWKDDEQVSVEVVMRTFKENSHKAKSLFIEAVKRIAKENWEKDIVEAKLLVNVVYCDPTLIPGVRPSFKDFTNVFIEAGKDDRKDKKYELLVTTLKRMAEMNAKVDPQDHATMSSIVYLHELPFIQDFDQEKLDSALKACHLDVPGFKDLYELLHYH